MANPDYATLLPLIAAASGAAKTALEAQCFVFDEPLTDTAVSYTHLTLPTT